MTRRALAAAALVAAVIGGGVVTIVLSGPSSSARSPGIPTINSDLNRMLDPHPDPADPFPGATVFQQLVGG